MFRVVSEILVFMDQWSYSFMFPAPCIVISVRLLSVRFASG